MRDAARVALALARGDAVPPVDLRGLDSAELVRLLALHQVDGLAYWLWKHLPTDATSHTWRELPEAVMEAGRLAFLLHAARSEFLVRDLAAIQLACARRGVETIAFKGPWMAFVAYPHPGTRPVGDIDLGLREADYRGAVEALAEVGYLPVEGLPTTPKSALEHAHYGRQLRFVAAERRMVELHFRMVNVGPPGREEHDLWAGAVLLRIGDEQVRVPGPETMLAHLLLHANQHAFTKLRLLHDVRFAIARAGPDFDFDQLLRWIRFSRSGASAYHGLLLAREMAGAEVPAELLDSLRPGLPRRILFNLLWNLSRVRRLEARQWPNTFEHVRLFLLELGTPLDKLRYAAGIVREAGGAGSVVKRIVQNAPARRRGFRMPTARVSGQQTSQE